MRSLHIVTKSKGKSLTVDIFTTRVAKQAKVMFSQASVCPTAGAKADTTPPPSQWIRSMGGRYASYWNAYLFIKILKIRITLISP